MQGLFCKQLILCLFVLTFGCSRQFDIIGTESSFEPLCQTPICLHPGKNLKPTAEDAYVEPEKDRPFDVTLNHFLASDPNGDPLTLAMLGRDGNEALEIRDQWSSLTRSSDAKSIRVQSHLIGAASYPVRISDGTLSVEVILTISPRNPLLEFKPALAVNDSHCLLCHSQISGNFVTTLGTDDNSQDILFWNNGETTSRQFAGDFVWPNYTNFLSKSFFGTTFIRGRVFLPHRELSEKAKNRAREIIQEGLAPIPNLGASLGVQRYDFTGLANDLIEDLSSPKLGIHYLFAVNQSRTAPFIDLLDNWNGFNKSIRPLTEFEEVANVKISTPSQEVLIEKVDKSLGFSYYPQGPSSQPLQNFGKRPLRKSLEGTSDAILWGNDPDQTMICDGDLFVDGPVLLKNLSLQTKVGCRIHATGVIVLSGSIPSATSPNKNVGYMLVSPGTGSVLQLVSSRAVLLGMGYVNKSIGDHASKANALNRVTQMAKHMVQGTVEDLKLMVGDTAEDSLILDAGTDPNKPETSYGDAKSDLRKVDLEKILVNAPLIQSRYTGDFKGIVIGNFALWSLGQFKYQYDPIFDTVPILPMLDPSHFFEVQKCPADKKVRRLDTLIECQL